MTEYTSITQDGKKIWVPETQQAQPAPAKPAKKNTKRSGNMGHKGPVNRGNWYAR